MEIYMAVTREDVAKLYVATFNRAPDSDGLDYWVNTSFDGKATIEQIAASFFDQAETIALYPTTTTDTAFVESIYQNIFARAADAAGLAYWTGELGASLTRPLMIEAMKNGALGDDATLLTNKASVGLAFADAGLNSTTDAATVLSSVTKDVTTVTTAKASVDTLKEASDQATYDAALVTYNAAVTTAAASKAAADTAALSVSTTTLANASLTAANTANTDAAALVTAAAALVTAAAATTSTTDDTTSASLKASADTAATTTATLVSTATTAVSAATAAAALVESAVVTSTAALTTKIDTLTGDSSNNLFISDAANAVAADQIDGGGGTDIFRLYAGAGAVDLPTLTSIEQIELVNNTASLDLSGDSTLQLLTLDNTDSGLTYTIKGAVSTVVKNIASTDTNATETVTLAYGATDTTSKVTLNAFGNDTNNSNLALTGAGLTTLTLQAATAASYVTLTSTGALETLTISGNIALDINATAETTLTNVNASTMTAGGVTLDVGASAGNTSITGSGYADTVTATAAVNYTVDLGAGDDMLTTGDASGEITSADTLNGGAGTADILAISSVVASEVAASDAIQAKITNFERLRIADATTSALGHDFDISQFGINYLQLDGVVTGGKTVSGFTSGATVELRDDANMSSTLTVTMTDATNTANTTDVLNIFANANLLTNAATFTHTLDIAGIETVNINAVDRDATVTATDGYAIALSTDTSLKTLNIIGSEDVTYNSASATALTTVDGSAATGVLTLTLDGFGSGSNMTITGGTGDDVINGSRQDDTIAGGAGDDTLKGGSAGDDTFVVSSATESAGDTINGESNTNTLKIKSTAVGTGGITQNLIDLATSTNTILNNVAFTATTPFANIENVDASEATSSMKIIGKNANNKITTGTAADTIKLNGGTNTIVYTATNSVDGKEDSILDFVKGTDTLLLTGDHGSNTINLAGVTATNNGDSADNTFQYTDLGAVDIILQVGVVGSTNNMTTSVQLGDATTAFTSNATTIVASANTDYIVAGSATQNITLGSGADVLTIAVGGSNDGSEDTITDYTKASDILILTGNNGSTALDLTNVTTAQVGATDYYEKSLGTSHIIFKTTNDAALQNTDMSTFNIQLGSTSAAFKSSGNITAGAEADVLQSTSSGSSQTIIGGAGNDIFFYDSSTTDATGTTQTITGGNNTDTIIVAGGTTAVNFSTDTINTMETLELTKNLAGNADTNAQSLTMTDAQVDGFTIINASYNGSIGDKITLYDAMTSNMLDGTVMNGSLNIVLKDTNNALTSNAATMDATTDVLYIDGSAMTTGSALTFDGSAEAQGTFVITGGAGADVITAGGQGADTFTLKAGLDVLNYTNINQFGDTYTDFTSNATDTIKFARGVLQNAAAGDQSDTLESITSSGTVGANTVFLEITDSTSSGAADTKAEVIAALANLDTTNIANGSDKIMIALNDGTDTYLWYFEEVNGVQNTVDAADTLTLITKLTGVTDVANGDFVSL